MGWFVPQVLGVGYQHVGSALNGGMAVKLMVLLLVLKFFAVTFSYASGNAGGIFGPSLFLGAMLGGIVGTVAQHFLPAYVASPGAYALVGMGTAFAGIVRAPMTSVVMIFETTRDYSVIVPLMISNLVSFFISSKFQREPIYGVLARQDGIHLPSAHSRSLEGQRQVFQCMKPAKETLSAQLTLQQASEIDRQSVSRAWPVLDDYGVIGVLNSSTLQKALADGPPTRPIRDILEPGSFPHVHADQPLPLALERMGATQLDLLPVVSRANIHKLEGVITLQDILDAYRLPPPKSDEE
jgi:CIC family chloride channel protein